MISLPIVKNTAKGLVRTRQAVLLSVLFMSLATLFARFVLGGGSLSSLTMVYWFFATALNIIFSAGIIGNDVSTGEIQLLVTKPILRSQIFLSRASGVMLIMVPVLLGMSILLLLVSPLFERIGFLAWLAVTVMMILSQILVTAVTTALSVFLPGNSNAIAMLLGAVVYMLLDPMVEFHSASAAPRVVLDVIFPHPIALRELAVQIANSEPVIWSPLFHAFMYTTGALLLGILAFRHRQFQIG